MRKILVLMFVLAACGDGRLSPQGGSITGVGAGSGLTGGGTSGSVTVNVGATVGGGLEVAADGVGLTTACATNGFLAWSGAVWACQTMSSMLGSGTQDYLSRWTPDGTHLGNSLVSQNTTTTGLSFTTTDVGVNPYPSTGSWSTAPGWLVVGPNATTGTAGNLGLGYSASMDSATITSIAPGVAWKPMIFSAQSFAFRPQGDYGTMEVSISTTGLNVAQDLNVGNDASSDRVTFIAGLRTATLTQPALGTLTAWGNTAAVFGPNATSDTGAALGLGYNTTADASVIISAAPNVSWKPLVLASNSTQFYNGATTAMTVDSAVTTTVNTIVGDDASDVLDVNGNLSKFGSIDGEVFIYNDIIGAGYADNTDGVDLAINYVGYAAGATRYRDLVIYDGKSSPACTLTGSTKTLNCVGGLQVNGVAVNTFTTNNVVPKGDGTGLTSSTISDNGTTVTVGANLLVTGATAQVLVSAGVSPRFVLGQTGQDSWYFYQDASASNLNIYNGSTGVALAFASTGNASFVHDLGVNGNTTLGDTSADKTFFGGAQGYVYVLGDELNYYHGTNATATGWINYAGYSGGSTQWRNLSIGDGKGTAIVTVTGSTQAVAVAGSTTFGDDTTTDTTTVNGTLFVRRGSSSANLVMGDATNKDWTFYLQGTDLRLFEYNTTFGTGGNDRFIFQPGGTMVIARTIGTAMNTSSANLHVRDTTSAATGVGGSLQFDGAYNGTTVINGAEIKAMKANATAGNTEFDLVFGARINAGNIQEGCRLYGATRKLNCIGGLQVNGVDVTTGGVTGSGTTNRVAKYTSSSAIGNTTYPIDDAAGTLTLGDANTDVATWTGAQIVNNSATAVTVDNPLIKINDTRTETAGDSSSSFHIYGAQINMTNSVARDGVAPGGPTGVRALQITSVMTPTGSCGVESTCGTINQGIRLAVSGGDYNRSIVSSAGDWLLGGSGSLYVGSFAGDAKVLAGVTAYITGSTGDIYTAGNLQVDGSSTLGNAVGDTLTVSGNYSYWSAQDAVLEGIGSLYLYSNYDNVGGGNLYLQDATTDATYLYGNFAMTSAGGGVTPFQMTVGAQAWGMRIAGGGNDLFQLGTVGGTIASFSFGPSAISGTAEFKITTTTVSTPVNLQVDGNTVLGDNTSDTTTIKGNTTVQGANAGNSFAVTVGPSPTAAFWIASTQSTNTSGNTNLGDDSADLTTITGTAVVTGGTAPTANAVPAGTVLTIQNPDAYGAQYLALRGPNNSNSSIIFTNGSAAQDGAITYSNSLHGMQFQTNQTYRMYLDPNGTLKLGMSGGAVVGGNSVLLSTNTNTGQTASYAQVDISAAGSFDATLAARTSTGGLFSVTSTRSAGAFGLTNKGLVVNASGAQVNIALETQDGDNRFNYVSGSSTFYAGAILGDAAGDTTTLTGILTANGTTSSSTTNGQKLTVVNGLPQWNPSANEYGQKRYEWFDEWMQVGLTPITTTSVNYAPIGTSYQVSLSGTGAQIVGAPGGATSFANRMGVMSIETGTATTGLALIRSSIDSVDFNTGNWYTSNAVYFPTLSDVTNTYIALTGFWDASSAKAGPTDGCYAFYDSQSAMTGHTGLATGNKWKFACSQNGTRTQVILDGTTQGGITTVDTPVAATTWYRVEITVNGTSSAFVTINGTKAATITTNIPSGNTRTTAFGVAIEKTAGTTSRQIYLDQSEVIYDATNVRSP